MNSSCRRVRSFVCTFLVHARTHPAPHLPTRCAVPCRDARRAQAPPVDFRVPPGLHSCAAPVPRVATECCTTSLPYLPRVATIATTTTTLQLLSCFKAWICRSEQGSRRRPQRGAPVMTEQRTRTCPGRVQGPDPRSHWLTQTEARLMSHDDHSINCFWRGRKLSSTWRKCDPSSGGADTHARLRCCKTILYDCTVITRKL
jgi:hypothetical protein